MVSEIAVVGAEPAWVAEQCAQLVALGHRAVPATAGQVEPGGVALVDIRAADAIDRLRRAGVAMVLACDDASLDAMLPSLGGSHVEPLHLPCRPVDYALALAALAIGSPPAAAAEGDPASRLLRISQEVARIAEALAPERACARVALRDGDDAAPVDAASLRALLAARRLRDEFLPPDLFGEPAWDMILDLAASRIERRPVSVTDLTVAAAVPPTTALRHLKAMFGAGLVERRPDPRDARRVFVELAGHAFDRVLAWAAASRKAGLTV